VQGVGFRFTFRGTAEELGVKGYVRNLPDGTVEAVCEGPESTIDLLRNSIAGRMGEYIGSCEVESLEKEVSGKFRDFRILT
jgi:acylphosphatase